MSSVVTIKAIVGAEQNCVAALHMPRNMPWSEVHRELGHSKAGQNVAREI